MVVYHVREGFEHQGQVHFNREYEAKLLNVDSLPALLTYIHDEYPKEFDGCEVNGVLTYDDGFIIFYTMIGVVTNCILQA